MRIHKWLPRTLVLAGISLLAGNTTFAESSPAHRQLYRCNQVSGILCAEQRDNPGEERVNAQHQGKHQCTLEESLRAAASVAPWSTE